MLSSLKKWVQDVAVDLTPPTASQLPPPSRPSSSSFLSSTSIPGTTAAHQRHSSSATPLHKYNDRPSTISSSSAMCLSRPISMDGVYNSRNSKMVATSVLPPPASPIDLDLSHLNREEQEHIANVLRRARAVDEQPSPMPPVAAAATFSSIRSPPASILSASLSSTSSSSSSSSSSPSTSTNSFVDDQQLPRPNDDDHNEFQEDDDGSGVVEVPESTTFIISIRRCQMCEKELPYGTTSLICLLCEEEENRTENARQSLITTEDSPRSPVFNGHDEDKIYDNVRSFDSKEQQQEETSPVREYASYIAHHYQEKINDDDREEEQQPPLRKSQSPPSPKSSNLTEIDEDDFFYQGPSPYASIAANMSVIQDPIIEEVEKLSMPTYTIDELIDEEEENIDERDHVKELEETIANISRHFPSSPVQIDDIELNPLLHHTSTGKIDIDAILEMEIESPTADDMLIQSSSTYPPPLSLLPSLHVSIPVNHSRRTSLSRSSGVREKLTDLLTTMSTEIYPTENRLLQRATSAECKRVMPICRPKRNLPSVPMTMSHIQLRRANSDSRFCLPAVPGFGLQANVDDESDLLEIDLNDPTGSIMRTARSKTEPDMITNTDTNHRFSSLITAIPSPSVDELLSSNKRTKQLRDQTTNTPLTPPPPPPVPLNIGSGTKLKKKIKKKGSFSPNQTPPTQTNGHATPAGISPTRSSVPLTPSPLPPATSSTANPPKLQKSTSTEISYPFPVLKLILSRDNINPSRRDGTDLGLRITGGHSIPNCMEVAACIERIDTHHRNYHILKNAVQEGDEVLEVGGVSLRGKSALFVQNLMHSIENEFELVVRSQHILPPPIEIHKPETFNSNIQSPNMLTVSSLTVDPNISRRHSMGTSQSIPTHPTNNTVVKSQSIIMSLPINNSNNLSEEFLSPTLIRKKSVSSKERLFSVESLHRTLSTKSNEQLIKVIPPETYSNKYDEQNQTSLTITTPENKILSDDSTIVSQPSQRRRTYEPRNSLFPNDPRLNGSGSNPSIERRSSNESDESDNLSQYFRSPSSRKSSLITTNNPNPDLSHERSQSITPSDNEAAVDASRRLQNFLKSKDEKRVSGGSVGDETMNLNKTEERKSSSGLSSFQFLKKKPKSVDFPNQPNEVRENDYVGDIELQIGHDSEREQLVLRIIQAHNLLAKDTNGYSDPFVKVYLLPGRDQENKRRTKYISKNLNPVWDHTVIYGNMHREELQYKMLEFTVWDYDRFKANDFLGQITIDLKDTNVIDDKPHWYRLQALRSREESTNRGSSPRLYQMTSTESTASSTLTLNKNTINMQSRINQRK